ncbi:shikimate 5-dehydrogenase [Arthrobacter zhangbolii]|uniref:Shikimate 5-dehydrogenase n=1 Tax=Arthrobacter zhangbolii TaxID=2886936 RepID=A0A9X1M7Q2_9MICC|nr:MULTISPECIES: shikimate 5-dehydrogenase [Arthrobacter]MCC3272766.1 shikimate 5-dehydrogenase [Arthrobacter zhangbolii]MCC3294974.1 shikimate 5-dehydrogenase [Arthrobacter zhangbolii]MDN3903829.1 shikimate 5-dehydrogenase [Arthrobacter sp. YD2]UON91399.1 shikimate 5-dehydrogenase [Arthrobacter zhangbolii]
MPILNKDMTLCISLAARPSNIGTRFHNYLYDQLGLNYVYKAFAPADLAQAIAGVRGLPIRGAAVSMPYKEDVIALVDRMDPSARAIDSVNTIVNDDGVLTAYNTDYLAIARLLRDHSVPASHSVLLRGSGGMAKAVAAALRDAGFSDVTVVARNEGTGRALADLYDFSWQAEPGTSTADLLINVTPLGMAGTDESVQSFTDDAVAAAKVVFDVVALPAETPLIAAARKAEKQVITGAEVIAIQAEEQFVLYTGVRPTPEQVRAASEFSRA